MWQRPGAEGMLGLRPVLGSLYAQWAWGLGTQLSRFLMILRLERRSAIQRTLTKAGARIVVLCERRGPADRRRHTAAQRGTVSWTTRLRGVPPPEHAAYRPPGAGGLTQQLPPGRQGRRAATASRPGAPRRRTVIPTWVSACGAGS
jgi:hypothetical protein